MTTAPAPQGPWLVVFWVVSLVVVPCAIVGWFCFVLCEGRGAICVCDKAGGWDGGDELCAICVCCLFFCVSALPSAAVERGVYDGWVGGGEVVVVCQ